jgi:PAS domain S-box-containing protein
MLLVTTISIAMLGYFLISQEYIRFSESSKVIREQFIEKNKEIIKHEVQISVELINHIINKSREDLKNKIRAQLYQGYDIVEHLYYKNRDSMSEQDLKKLILSVLRPIKHNSGRGYYSVTTGSGKALLLQSDKKNRPIESEEGKNRLNQKDIKGFYFVRELINKAKNQGEGFVEYYRQIPNDPSRIPYLKLTYVKYFEPYDWVIATGDYYDSHVEELKHSIIERLANVRFGEDGYIFGVSHDGEPLFSDGVITLGTENLWNLTDTEGVKIIQEERKIVEEQGKGFLEYHWNKLNDNESHQKISYIEGIPEWRWIIGAGVYLDDIEFLIAEEKTILKERINNHIMKVVGLLALIVVIIANTSIYISVRLKKNFKTFVSFFQKAENENVQIEPETIHFSEFQAIAKSANKLIDKRTKAEKNLQLFKEVFYYSTDSIEIIKPDFTFYEQNPSHRKLFGYSNEALEDETPVVYMGEDNFNEMKNALLEYEFYRAEIYMKTSDERELFIDISAFPILDNDKEVLFYVAIKRDNTEQKEIFNALQKSEVKYRNLIETMEEGIMLVDEDENILFANTAAGVIFDIPYTDLINTNLRDVILKEDFEQILYQTQKRKEGKKDRYEIRCQTFNGETKTLLVNAIPLFENDEFAGSLGVFADISDIKNSQHEIEKSLKEKVVMLREIHHRVKNNMQIIISLLHLQSIYIEDEEIVDRFKIIENRIRSMALIHEKLYESENFVDIDFKDYIEALFITLFNSTGLPENKIRFDIDAEPITLDLNQAVPCGLLCNEILTNIFKHAFPGDKVGTVYISMKKTKGGKSKLIIKDDGVGFTDDLATAGQSSLGLQLIQDLISQLGGTLKLNQKNGTSFTITF